MTFNRDAEIGTEEDFDPFAGGEIALTVPITPEQEELWLSVQLDGTPANLAYNQALALTLVGELDRGILRDCLNALVERHEALRMTLSADGRSLCIAANGTMPFTERDLSTQGAESRRQELASARSNAVNEELHLTRGPLIKSVLLRISDREHQLILVAHHLVCDGASLSILVSELAELYSARKSGSAPNLPEPTPFSTYAASRATEAGGQKAKQDLAFWRERYRTIPPELELPLDRPRPPGRTFVADRLDTPLPAALVRDLKTLAAERGTSFVTLLFCAFQAYLQRITGQRSFALILPAAGQTVVGKKSLVGHCVRTLPIRAEVDPRQPFNELLRQVKTSMLDALEHPRVTFGGLLKELKVPRDPSRIPLATVAFNVDFNATSIPFANLELKLETLPRTHESFEMFVSFTISGDDVVIETSFNTQLFDRSSIERRMADLLALLDDVVRDPSKPVAELEIMDEDQRRMLLFDYNRTSVEQPGETLCARFCEIARRSPERIAVSSGGRTMSYGELERASAALAHDLMQNHGVGPGSVVGVFLSRSVELLVAPLGIMRAGAAYVPLDPDYPAERLSFIASDTRLSVVVTQPDLVERLPQGARAVLASESRAPAPAELDGSSLSAVAYIIYTSGSTGKPKGALIEHRNVANVLASMARRPGLDARDVVMCVASICFDMSVPDFYLPLTVGAGLVIATQDEIIDGQKLGKLLAESGATFMQATPAGFRVLLESGWQGQSSLVAICAGEALPSELAALLGKRVRVLWNGYGPTETTVYTTFEQVQELPAPIGKPIDNARVYLLDENLRLVPAGVVGEIYVAGAGVSRGYHDRPELSRSRFVPDPFSGDATARMYKTGDLGRWRAGGKLEWLGRNDSQVKVRGFRIELGEIEARLGECAGVREGIVVVREDRPGDQRLVAYVRGAGSDDAESRIRDELRQRLPAYMVPQHVMFVPAFPLTPSGKIDRKALPAPEAGGGAAYREPASELEIKIAAEYRELLGAERVGRDDDFFSLGGHSLLALRLVARLRTMSAVDVPVRVFFSNATVKGLSDYIEAALVVQRGSGVRTSVGPSSREELVL